VADFTQINSELALFDPDLGHKPQIVVVNKIDLPDVQARWDQLKVALKKLGYEAQTISAVTRENLTPILWKAHEVLLNTPKPEVAPTLPIYKPEEDPRDFSITGRRMAGGLRCSY
jgi:GTP-binding protein